MHTPRASDSEKVLGGGENDTEAGGVPCLPGRAFAEVQTFYLPGLPSPTPFGKNPSCWLWAPYPRLSNLNAVY